MQIYPHLSCLLSYTTSLVGGVISYYSNWQMFSLKKMLPFLVEQLSTTIFYYALIRPNKKIPVFRVARPYLNLLVKPRIFSGFLGILFLMHFERPNAFQNV